MTNRITIFDTTLRDGEQSPGMSMTRDEKLRVAEVLDAMGVDVIEAGFAIASQGDFEAVKAIAEVTKMPWSAHSHAEKPPILNALLKQLNPPSKDVFILYFYQRHSPRAPISYDSRTGDRHHR